MRHSMRYFTYYLIKRRVWAVEVRMESCDFPSSHVYFCNAITQSLDTTHWDMDYTSGSYAEHPSLEEALERIAKNTNAAVTSVFMRELV